MKNPCINNYSKKVTAITKSAKISPYKIETILAQIRNKSYKKALCILHNIISNSSRITWATLYSAISNAATNFKFEKENLIICEAYVTGGLILKRMQPRAKGRAFAIKKRYSHITISVCEKNIE